MPIPDGRESEAENPSFTDFADFLTPQSFLNRQGWEVPARRERIGALTVTDRITVADLLLAPGSVLPDGTLLR
ncbi:MAG: hypothetical protein EOP86_12660 [Verrucomicrobiaceae bacterium]|nr:MAG: hypothetical protein EOP86_12660 [Verrucomicrobiaceae bacterium]